MKNSGSQIEIELEPQPTPPKPYWFGRILAIVGIVFTGTVVLLEILGVIHELGEILAVLGTGLTVFGALVAATKEDIEHLRLELRLEMQVQGVRTRNAHAQHSQAVVVGLAEILRELRKK